MNYYYKVDKEGSYVGLTTFQEEDVYLTTTSMKPIGVGDSVKYNFDTDKWEYCFKRVLSVPAETPYMWVDYILTGIYSGKIYPQCGDTILPKSKDISILIPCYGKSKYIIDCVKSCLAQSMLPKKIIILLMDDESIAMEKELSKLSEKINCVIHEQLNASAARTKLVELCPTDWFIFLDADDMLKENFIEECYKQDASLIFPRVQHIEDNGEFIGEDVFTTSPPSNGFPIACLINNLTCLMHKDVFNDIGLDEELSLGGEDIDFFIRVFAQKKYKVVMADKTCYYYRHTNGLVSSHKFYESHAKAIAKNIEFLHSEYISMNGYREFETRFYLNPTLDTCAESVWHDPRKLINEKENVIYSKLYQSKNRTPIAEFNTNDFSFINVDEAYRDTFLYILKTFDVLFTEPLTRDTIFNENIGMIINNKILEDKQFQTLKDYDRLIYLLDNYACFDIGDTKEFFNDEEILLKIRETGKHNEIIKEQLRIMDKPIVEYPKDERESNIVSVVFALHEQCNRQCEYCNQPNFKDRIPLSDDEVFENFDTALSICEEKLSALGYIIQPRILGGEPTLWSEYLIQKIMDRLKDYRQIVLFTNGDFKDNLWYKSDKMFIVKHVCDWREHPEYLTREYLEKNEVPLIVVPNPDIPYAQEVLPKMKGKLDSIIISACMDSGIDGFDGSPEDVKTLNQLTLDCGSDLTNTCRTLKSIWIDCNKMEALGCCRSKIMTTVEGAIEHYINTTDEYCAHCNMRDTR